MFRKGCVILTEMLRQTGIRHRKQNTVARFHHQLILVWQFDMSSVCMLVSELIVSVCLVLEKSSTCLFLCLVTVCAWCWKNALFLSYCVLFNPFMHLMHNGFLNEHLFTLFRCFTGCSRHLKACNIPLA